MIMFLHIKIDSLLYSCKGLIFLTWSPPPPHVAGVEIVPVPSALHLWKRVNPTFIHLRRKKQVLPGRMII